MVVLPVISISSHEKIKTNLIWHKFCLKKGKYAPFGFVPKENLNIKQEEICLKKH